MITLNLQQLFTMQRQLDQHIEDKHELHKEDLIPRKLLALLVEMGELANETRCFKFWSVKPPAEDTVILEEFVDGVHFILSLGIEKGYDDLTELPNAKASDSKTAQFLQVFAQVAAFEQDQSKENYVDMFVSYMTLGDMFGFSAEHIEKAYISKNEVNFKRQEQGY